MSEYFSDREMGPRSREVELIGNGAWGGILALFDGAITNGGFGQAYPANCPDGGAVIGSSLHAVRLSVGAELPEIDWPYEADCLPGTLAILDLVEFTYIHIAKPIAYDYHDFFRHDHLQFNQDAGREEFRASVNRIFARNHLAYGLGEDGKVARSAGPVLTPALVNSEFATGDRKLDDLLGIARNKFLDPDPSVRREGLEKLWDAFERIKTILPGRDKKASANALINRVTIEPTLRDVLESEAISLTSIGNTFHIRHSETSQIELADNRHVDYLFHRLFALVLLFSRSL